MTRNSVSPAHEAQLQNRELLETLESLPGRREVELEKRQAELRRINAELEETNRGVVALYAELDEKAAALRSADELKGRFFAARQPRIPDTAEFHSGVKSSAAAAHGRRFDIRTGAAGGIHPAGHPGFDRLSQ